MKLSELIDHLKKLKKICPEDPEVRFHCCDENLELISARIDGDVRVDTMRGQLKPAPEWHNTVSLQFKGDIYG